MCPAPAHADQIILKNGDKITGYIRQVEDGSYILIDTVYSSRIYIDWQHVQSYINAETPLGRTLVDTNEGTLPIAVKAQDTKDAEKDSVPTLTVSSKDKEEPMLGLFSRDIKQSGEINVGAKLRRGNSEEDRLNLDATWKLRRPKDRLVIYTELNRTKDGEQTTEDNQTLDFTYDYFVGDKWFLQGNLEFKQDDVTELDLRTIAGAAIGYQFFESDDLNLQVLSGINYQNEEFANQSTEDSMGLDWGLKYDQKFWERLTFFHNHDLTTPIDDFSAFLFESKTGLKLPLIAALIGTTEIQYDYDGDPAEGAQEDDTIYRFKIGYSW